MEKILNAMEIDWDAITFWENESKIIPASATVLVKEKECIHCATEYITQYCPTCGAEND